MGPARILFILLLGGLAVAAQLLEDSNARWASTAVVVLAFVGAVAGPAMESLEKYATSSEEIARLLGRWPITAADASLGELAIAVSPLAARYAARPGEPPPYIQRDVEGELYRAIQARDFVLVVGPSGAGKSRTLLQILGTVAFRHHRIVRPRTPADLATLVGMRGLLQAGSTDPLVLWLDEVQLYFLDGGLDLPMVDEWCSGGRNRVVATVRPEPHSDLIALRHTASVAPPDSPAQAVARVLAGVDPIDLKAELSPAENARALAEYQGQDLSRGIGRQLLGAPELIQVLRYRAPAAPRGTAIVWAAADWQRTGTARRPSYEDLETLHEHYVREGDPAAQSFADGLDWALAPLDNGAAMLESSGDGYAANDYIADHLDGRTDESAGRTPIRLEAWEHVIAGADPLEALTLAATAYEVPHPEAATAALTRALTSDDPHVVAAAALAHGSMLEEAGHVTEAAAAYRLAAEQPVQTGPGSILGARLSAFYNRTEPARQPQELARARLANLPSTGMSLSSAAR